MDRVCGRWPGLFGQAALQTPCMDEQAKDAVYGSSAAMRNARGCEKRCRESLSVLVECKLYAHDTERPPGFTAGCVRLCGLDGRPRGIGQRRDDGDIVWARLPAKHDHVRAGTAVCSSFD